MTTTRVIFFQCKSFEVTDCQSVVFFFWIKMKGTHPSKQPLQDSNLHFDVMNIKFYLLSQEFAAGDTYVGGRGFRGGVRT